MAFPRGATAMALHLMLGTFIRSISFTMPFSLTCHTRTSSLAQVAKIEEESLEKTVNKTMNFYN
jgi:hypothetical protein